MKIPRYWKKGEVTVKDEEGKEVKFACYGWSENNLAEAEERGKERAQKVAERYLQGDDRDFYQYSDRQLREEILDEIKSTDGRVLALITRNAYGCHVLNCAGAMFVDIDIPPQSTGLVALIKSIFGVKNLTRSDKEKQSIEILRNLAKIDASFGARVYRTSAGLRYLLTHAVVNPSDQSTISAMESLGSDELYIKLCKAQDCFRARLTPKPWRCGLKQPVVRYPWTDDGLKDAFLKWEGQYNESAEKYATCQLVEVVGNENMHPEIAPIVELHDRCTKVSVSLPLA